MITEINEVDRPNLPTQPRLAQCDCGTPDAALFWCYVHGYLIKPPVVHRKKSDADLTLKRTSPRSRIVCECGRSFLAKRSDAKYCSQSCRRRASNTVTATDK
jgi:hypothetical protein